MTRTEGESTAWIIGDVEAIEMTTLTRRLLDQFDRILEMNSRVLDLIEKIGATQVIYHRDSSPEENV